MRHAIVISLVLLGTVTLPGSRGQMPTLSNATPSAQVVPGKQRDLTKLTAPQRHLYLSGQRGMEWLQRANRPDGRFVYGFLPALRLPMEGDSYVRQAGAAFALARAAHFFGDGRATAIARQALLTLLVETSVDAWDPALRNVPIHQANPLVSAGTLVAAIHELPAPAADLLDQADQLANLLRKQIQADGSLNVSDAEEGADALHVQGGQTEPRHAEAIQQYPGPALYGIIRSQRLRPAPWKLDALRNARAYYFGYWKQHRNMAMPVWHSGAYTEAYLLTREAEFAAAVFEINDWLCGLQYQQVDPARTAWVGGFPPSVDARSAPLAPDIGSAGALVSLVEACRLARATGDVQRYQRYRQALESGLQFLTSLQFCEANTQHFADWYRPVLVGAFHASTQDGNLRLDYAQHSLSALVQYLHYVADLP